MLTSRILFYQDGLVYRTRVITVFFCSPKNSEALIFLSKLCTLEIVRKSLFISAILTGAYPLEVVFLTKVLYFFSIPSSLTLHFEIKG